MNVTDLLDNLADGSMTLDEVAAEFAKRRWPVKKPPTAAQAYGVADDDAPDPDSWDVVNADSRLTAAQYRALVGAKSKAPR